MSATAAVATILEPAGLHAHADSFVKHGYTDLQSVLEFRKMRMWEVAIECGLSPADAEKFVVRLNVLREEKEAHRAIDLSLEHAAALLEEEAAEKAAESARAKSKAAKKKAAKQAKQRSQVAKEAKVEGAAVPSAPAPIESPTEGDSPSAPSPPSPPSSPTASKMIMVRPATLKAEVAKVGVETKAAPAAVMEEAPEAEEDEVLLLEENLDQEEDDEEELRLEDESMQLAADDADASHESNATGPPAEAPAPADDHAPPLKSASAKQKKKRAKAANKAANAAGKAVPEEAPQQEDGRRGSGSSSDTGPTSDAPVAAPAADLPAKQQMLLEELPPPTLKSERLQPPAKLLQPPAMLRVEPPNACLSTMPLALQKLAAEASPKTLADRIASFQSAAAMLQLVPAEPPKPPAMMPAAVAVGGKASGRRR